MRILFILLSVIIHGEMPATIHIRVSSMRYGHFLKNVYISTFRTTNLPNFTYKKDAGMTQAPLHDYIQVGFGTDLHRLVPGRGLRIGGADIPCEVAAVADSDGDALLHALVDAVLGASGQGDIGDHFPALAVAPGQDSAPMLAHALALAAQKGGVVVNVDCVIDLEAVKLGPWKAEIRASLARLFGIDPGRVNVKAKTAEGLGPIGAGEAIAAQAVVLLSFSGRGPA